MPVRGTLKSDKLSGAVSLLRLLCCIYPVKVLEYYSKQGIFNPMRPKVRASQNCTLISVLKWLNWQLWTRYQIWWAKFSDLIEICLWAPKGNNLLNICVGTNKKQITLLNGDWMLGEDYKCLLSATTSLYWHMTWFV